MSKRQLMNTDLVIELGKLVVENPDLRFGQILSNFGFVVRDEEFPTKWKDEFYLESEAVLERVRKKINEE
jgi:hypothetical protein